MGKDEKESFVLYIRKAYHLLQRRRKHGTHDINALIVRQFRESGYILDRAYDLRGIFHVLIITAFLLGFSGCGYKDDPYYTQDMPKGGSNTELAREKGEK